MTTSLPCDDAHATSRVDAAVTRRVAQHARRRVPHVPHRPSPLAAAPAKRPAALQREAGLGEPALHLRHTRGTPSAVRLSWKVPRPVGVHHVRGLDSTVATTVAKLDCAYASGACASMSTISVPPGLSTRPTCHARPRAWIGMHALACLHACLRKKRALIGSILGTNQYGCVGLHEHTRLPQEEPYPLAADVVEHVGVREAEGGVGELQGERVAPEHVRVAESGVEAAGEGEGWVRDRLGWALAWASG